MLPVFSFVERLSSYEEVLVIFPVSPLVSGGRASNLRASVLLRICQLRCNAGAKSAYRVGW